MFAVLIQLLQSSPTVFVVALLVIVVVVARLRSLRYAGPRRQLEMQFGASDVLDRPIEGKKI